MSQSDRPNVLLICVDHWPGSLLSVAGHPSILTPTLDQLALTGVHYPNTYSMTPVCIPARRALMTGTTSRTHGDRCFNETQGMPNLPTMAQTFRDAGYQAYAVGKLHVYPQRARIGFDEVILNEEGRHHLGMRADDYELFLAEQGHPGQELTHAMGNNEFMGRPWHLAEHLHVTNWTTHQMCRTIHRRDPTRPAFWYMSYNCPHPPLIPPASYLDMYRDIDIPTPFIGDWAADFDRLPYMLKEKHNRTYALTHYPDGRIGLRPPEMKLARQAFFALCTQIDHQIRLVIGQLREAGILNNTIIAFTSDHGEMMGNHNLYYKGVFYEESARIPLFIVPTADYRYLGHHRVDDRLVELRDIMPTLLDMAGIPIPETVEGISLLSDERRPYLYGEYEEAERGTRMIRDARYKLIYYPVGNRSQLFDIQADPNELHDLVTDPAHAAVLNRLQQTLIAELYGPDTAWVVDGQLVGLPDRPFELRPDRGLSAQRGWRFI